MIEPTSRYATLAQLTWVAPDGRTITYLARRIVPQPGSIPIQGGATVQQSDRNRLDLIAARTLQQSELFWRIADANGAMDPFDLTRTPGSVLRVPTPQV
jgi:hypothetical protein